MMGTRYPEIWNALAADFAPERIKTRPAGKGRNVSYITARTAMNRLDSVLGIENWWDDYERDPGGSDNILCRLSIRLPDGQVVTKCDAGAPGNTGDDGEDDKGAFSDAFKRAAVKFGVGRSLYGDGVYLCPPPKGVPAPIEPTAPAPAPTVEAPPPPSERTPPAPAPSGTRSNPRTGNQLFAWVKDQEKRTEVALLKYLNQWGKLQDFPGRLVDWDAEQVALAVAEAQRKLKAIAPPSVDQPIPFKTPGGFREWAESRMQADKAHAIGTELRFPGSWLQWSQIQCIEVYRALMEHETEDAAMAVSN